MTENTPLDGILYEHEDGRHAVALTAESATFAIGDPKWHRVGPVLLPAASVGVGREATELEMNLLKVTVAGLESSVGHLSYLLDFERQVADRCMAVMKSLMSVAEPIEDDEDLDCRIPAANYRQFVDDHAELIYTRHNGKRPDGDHPRDNPEAASTQPLPRTGGAPSDEMALVPRKVPASAYAWLSGGYTADFKFLSSQDQREVEGRAQRAWDGILADCAATPLQQAAADAAEWIIRGVLAAKLPSWHRMSDAESELVAVVQAAAGAVQGDASVISWDISEDTLTDGSTVFDVIGTSDQCKVTFHCAGEESAEQLAAALNSSLISGATAEAS